jgi:hypothetical protein
MTSHLEVKQKQHRTGGRENTEISVRPLLYGGLALTELEWHMAKALRAGWMQCMLRVNMLAPSHTISRLVFMTVSCVCIGNGTSSI